MAAITLSSTRLWAMETRIFYPLRLHPCQANSQNSSASLPPTGENKCVFREELGNSISCPLRSCLPAEVVGDHALRGPGGGLAPSRQLAWMFPAGLLVSRWNNGGEQDSLSMIVGTELLDPDLEGDLFTKSIYYFILCPL